MERRRFRLVWQREEPCDLGLCVGDRRQRIGGGLMYQVCYWDGGKGPWKRFLASEMHVLSSEFPTVDEALAKVRERMLKLASYPVGVFPAGDTEPVVIVQQPGYLIQEDQTPWVPRILPGEEFSGPGLVVVV